MMGEKEPIIPQLLNLDSILKDKVPALYPKMPRFAINYLKKKLHIDELNEILTIYADKDGVDFMESVVGYFGLNLQTKGLDNVSTKGRYIFVSNHPLGGLDGICLSAIIGRKFDKKIKYLVNDVLYFIKNLQSIFVPVNKYGSQSKDKASAINDAYCSDNQIVTFPAGLCSRKIGTQIIDLEWKKSFVLKAIETKRDIIPIYFEAKNSNFFYRFANLRKYLGIKFNIELFYLPDEMFRAKKQTFSITFGVPIPWESLDNSKTPQQWANQVKKITYNLASNGNTND